MQFLINLLSFSLPDLLVPQDKAACSLPPPPPLDGVLGLGALGCTRRTTHAICFANKSILFTDSGSHPDVPTIVLNLKLKVSCPGTPFRPGKLVRGDHPILMAEMGLQRHHYQD